MLNTLVHRYVSSGDEDEVDEDDEEEEEEEYEEEEGEGEEDEPEENGAAGKSNYQHHPSCAILPPHT
jgi:hypothetical protein